MTDKTWTMNCVITGAKVAQLLNEGKALQLYSQYYNQALEVLTCLTSALSPHEAEYLLWRVEEELR